MTTTKVIFAAALVVSTAMSIGALQKADRVEQLVQMQGTEEVGMYEEEIDEISAEEIVLFEETGLGIDDLYPLEESEDDSLVSLSIGSADAGSDNSYRGQGELTCPRNATDRFGILKFYSQYYGKTTTTIKDHLGSFDAQFFKEQGVKIKGGSPSSVARAIAQARFDKMSEVCKDAGTPRGPVLTSVYPGSVAHNTNVEFRGNGIQPGRVLFNGKDVGKISMVVRVDGPTYKAMFKVPQGCRPGKYDVQLTGFWGTTNKMPITITGNGQGSVCPAL